MRAARCRHRELDPLASPEAVRAVCRLLREQMPDTISSSEKQLARFLLAVCHVERRPATDTIDGSPEPLAARKVDGGGKSASGYP
jgi:hypothetical protein